MNCRIGCGACCIVISITSALPGMPDGKPAGVRCVNLSDNNVCMIYDSPDYPEACKNLTPSEEMCGNSSDDAFEYLKNLERLTKP